MHMKMVTKSSYMSLDSLRLSAPSSDDYAEVGRLWRWVIDLESGTVTEEQVDDRPGDFGRVADSVIGLNANYGYLMAMAGEGNSEEPVYGSALWKYDLNQVSVGSTILVRV